MSADGFGCFCEEKIQRKVSDCLKTLKTVKILPVTLFRELVPAFFPYPCVTLKVVLKAACDPEIFPKTGHERTYCTPKEIISLRVHRKISTNESEG